MPRWSGAFLLSDASRVDDGYSTSARTAVCDGQHPGVRPAFACRVEDSECNVIILNARDVLDEAVAVDIKVIWEVLPVLKCPVENRSNESSSS
jgi:hypothetical protein